MKQIINSNNETIIEQYLGKNVTIFCCRYTYTGKMIKLDDYAVVLEDCKIVYETGSFEEKKWKDVQSLCVKEWSITRQSIEAFGVLEKS